MYCAEAVWNNAVFCSKEAIGREYAAAAFEKIFGKGRIAPTVLGLMQPQRALLLTPQCPLKKRRAA
jgi:hypothetical protein